MTNSTVYAGFQGDQIGIAPRMFKALVGRGHPEFSTNRQQDAQEFLLHFINMVEVNSKKSQSALCFLPIFCLNYNLSLHRGIVALGPILRKLSGSWWKRGLSVSSRRKPSTHRGWITLSSYLCPWIRQPTKVRMGFMSLMFYTFTLCVKCVQPYRMRRQKLRYVVLETHFA